MLPIAFGALALTITLVVARPRIGRFGRLDPALGAIPGVLIMLATGVLSWRDLLRGGELLWRPLLTVASVMAMTQVAHRLGILDRVARSIELRTRGPVPHAFVTVYVIGALTAAIFNNDAAILLLTPIIVPLIRRLYPKRPYLVVPFSFAVFASAGIAPLCTSNPMNLVVAERVGLGFNAYALRMIPVAVASSVCTYAMLRIAFRSMLEDDIPARGPEQGSLAPMESAANAVLAILGAMLLAYPILSYFDGPVWIAAACGALVICVVGVRAGQVSVVQALGAVAWDVLAFLFVIFVTALGLENVGVTHALAQVYDAAGEHRAARIAVTGGLSAIGSAMLNNHPAAALNALAIAELPGDREWRTLAALVGGDLGPRFLPMGSLAGLLWIEMLHRLGVEIRTSDFVRIGLVVTVPALLAALALLYVETWIVP
ncbi:ArsB/NhaD family transporter [Pendulispora albinea]|uniref:Arsenic transporter n=1 Tax=Pendulispora albinea TaxID=2741071 RepID=A0ABZ2LZA8_9BACT